MTHPAIAPSAATPIELRARFQATVSAFHSIVCCATCGSTYVDQRSIAELYCSDCGATAPWNAHRFVLVRSTATPDLHDVDIIADLRRRSQYDRVPGYRAIDELLAAFDKVLLEASIDSMTPLDQRQARISEAWARCRAQIDDLICTPLVPTDMALVNTD